MLVSILFLALFIAQLNAFGLFKGSPAPTSRVTFDIAPIQLLPQLIGYAVIKVRGLSPGRYTAHVGSESPSGMRSLFKKVEFAVDSHGVGTAKYPLSDLSLDNKPLYATIFKTWSLSTLAKSQAFRVLFRIFY